MSNPQFFRIPPELADVVNQVGDFMEYWGFKKVHGRIWTHLFVSKNPLDAQDLIERLGISKALVSMSIADLMDYEVISVAGKSSRGTINYCANPDVTGVITNVLRMRERRMLARVASAVKLLQALPMQAAGGKGAALDLAPDRVDILLDFVRTSEQCLDAMLQMGPASFAEFKTYTHVPPPKI